MKFAICAIVVANAFAISLGSVVAEEQTTANKDARQPTVMSDAQLDNVVGGNIETWGLLLTTLPDSVILDPNKPVMDVVNDIILNAPGPEDLP